MPLVLVHVKPDVAVCCGRMHCAPHVLRAFAAAAGVTTMALSEMNTTQWDDLIALSLALVRGPG